RLTADPDSAREIERLARVRDDLRRLPPIEPPHGVWERIAAQAARPRARMRPALAAAAAAVAAVAGLLLAAPWRAGDPPETPCPAARAGGARSRDRLCPARRGVGAPRADAGRARAHAAADERRHGGHDRRARGLHRAGRRAAELRRGARRRPALPSRAVARAG